MRIAAVRSVKRMVRGDIVQNVVLDRMHREVQFKLKVKTQQQQCEQCGQRIDAFDFVRGDF